MFLWCFQATAEANNLAAVAGAKDLYNKSMEQVSTYPSLNTLKRGTSFFHSSFCPSGAPVVTLFDLNLS